MQIKNSRHFIECIQVYIFYMKKTHLYAFFELFLSLVVFLESFYSANGDSFSMTCRAFIEVFFHMFPDFLWLEADSIDLFPAFTTKKSYITAIRIEVVFSFFPKGWDIYEVSVGRCHDAQYREFLENAKPFSDSIILLHYFL